MATVSFVVNITINAVQTPLKAVADPLNLTGTVGAPFSAVLTDNIQGGKPPYTLAVTGTLPDGLSADKAGNITGTPTTAGTTTINVAVTDSGV